MGWWVGKDTNISCSKYEVIFDKNIFHLRMEAAEERELKAQLLVKDLKALQAENKSLAKKLAQSSKT